MNSDNSVLPSHGMTLNPLLLVLPLLLPAGASISVKVEIKLAVSSARELVSAAVQVWFLSLKTSGRITTEVLGAAADIEGEGRVVVVASMVGSLASFVCFA